ncbi:hypothetical protein M513_02501 [Trichuris suis]|uniref:Uncharacterized protein n=1 Tax=Trichuris suis TaxID=68888 RepID=A0A085MHX8_9BILA|nr:hypothetical protein M513_02501 [Trichuris suis]
MPAIAPWGFKISRPFVLRFHLGGDPLMSAAQVGQLAHSFPYQSPFYFWHWATLGLHQPKSNGQDQHSKMDCQKATAYCDGTVADLFPKFTGIETDGL